METLEFVDWCKTEMLEKELFEHLIVYIYKMCLQIIYQIYMYKKGFGIK